MRKSSRRWWIVLVLLIGMGIAGQVQAQGGWNHLMQNVARAFHRATHAITAVLSGSEKVDSPSQETVQVVVPQPGKTKSETVTLHMSPQGSTDPSTEVDGWSVQLSLPLPTSSDTLPLEDVALPWFTEDSTQQTYEQFDLEQFLDLLASPVPNHLEWDEQDWLPELDPETEINEPFDIGQFQDRIIEEIERQSGDLQRQWESLDQLDELDQVYSDE